MSYHKKGDAIETKLGLKGKIVSINYRDKKVESMTLEADDGQKDYYKGERVFILAANVKPNGTNKINYSPEQRDN